MRKNFISEGSNFSAYHVHRPPPWSYQSYSMNLLHLSNPVADIKVYKHAGDEEFQIEAYRRTT